MIPSRDFRNASVAAASPGAPPDATTGPVGVTGPVMPRPSPAFAEGPPGFTRYSDNWSICPGVSFVKAGIIPLPLRTVSRILCSACRMAMFTSVGTEPLPSRSSP